MAQCTTVAPSQSRPGHRLGLPSHDGLTDTLALETFLQLRTLTGSTRSTVVTSQIPVAKWHEWIGDPTLADAILDRLVHNAYKLSLKGPSRRKEKMKGNNQ